MLKFRQIAATVSLATAFLGGAPVQAADAYPSGPITMIVPWNAGGAIDVTGRKIAELMSKEGVTVVIENIAGASSLIGLTKLSRAAPDGYTLGLATPSLMGAIAMRTTALTQASFTILNQAGVDELLLAVPKDSPANDIASFVKLMKEKPKGVSIGIPGTNNVNQIFAATLSKATGAAHTDVPYTGGSKVLVDVAGGHVDAGVVKASEAIPMITGGQIKAIGVFSDKRIPALPDLPTFIEKGIDVYAYGELKSVTYLLAPKGLTPDRAAEIETIFGKVLNGHDYLDFTAHHGMSITDLRGAAMEKEAVSIQETFNKVAPQLFKPE